MRPSNSIQINRKQNTNNYKKRIDIIGFYVGVLTSNGLVYTRPLMIGRASSSPLPSHRPTASLQRAATEVERSDLCCAVKKCRAAYPISKCHFICKLCVDFSILYVLYEPEN